MPITGNHFTIQLKQSHLGWGVYRHTNSRDLRAGEAYLPIPKKFAVAFNVLNSNAPGANNLYSVSSTDGFFNGSQTLKSGGSTVRGDIYAKQFHGNGDMRLMGNWFTAVNAKVGDLVKIQWTSPTEILITKR